MQHYLIKHTESYNKNFELNKDQESVL